MLDGQSPAEALITVGYQPWTDYIATTRTKVINDNVVGSTRDAAIVFRYNDPANFYWAGIGLFGNYAGIGRCVNGIYELLISTAENDQAIVYGQDYDLKVVVNKDTIQLYVNNTLLLTFKDATFTSGGVGLRMYNSHAQYAFINVVSSASPIPWIIGLISLGTLVYVGVKKW